MNRKKFLEEISKLAAVGVFSGAMLEGACSRSSQNTRLVGSSTDSISAANPANPINPAGFDSDALLLDDKRVISKDTINSAYDPPVIENYTRARYCDIVGQNAEKIFPRCRPYLELILKSNNDYRTIFDIPPEYHIGLLNQESEFDPNAVSSAPAVGIAQFMRDTARGMDMKVYDGRRYKELYTGEKRMRELSEKINVLWNNKILPSLRNNRFKEVEQYKKEYDVVVEESASLKRDVYNMYLNELDGMDDERKDWQKSIPKSARLLAELARASEGHFGGKPSHNILRGVVSYNCGFGNSKKWKGIPVIQETVGYLRNIMVNADKVSPHQKADMIYDANLQIMMELLANKVYRLDMLNDFEK